MLHHVSEILGRLRGLSEAERHELFKRLDQRMEKLTLWASHYRGRLRTARGLTGRARLVLVARKVLATSRAVVRALAGRRLGPAAATSEKPTGPAEQAEDSRRVLRCYMPRPYGGRVFLLRAEELRAARPDLGWSGLLSRPTVTVIPGDHHTCITRHVAVFAEQLEAMLGLGLDPQHSMPTLDPRGSRMP
jgi:thioesterase domain-containing protein